MIIGSSSLRALIMIGIAAFAAACDGGSPSRTRDDIAADSALASDLALANRDTTLVDSIGEYRPPDAAERDTATVLIAPETVPVTPKIAPPSVVQPAKPALSPTPTARPTATPAATPAATASSSPARRGASACSVPGLADQQECVRATLASADMRLNRIYRALITETRRQEKVPNGGRDPASVERLRVSQRSWLVYRDTECRRRGRGKEGVLWARPRVKCLGEFSLRRANELADNFSRLTAH